MAYTTIDDPSAHFQTALYNGSSSSVTVTNDGNSNLKPDWLWFKRRSGTASDHNVFDTSRGLTERLFPNLTSASDTTSDNGITSLTDGFTTGTSYGNVNGNGETFVTWQWKANGGTTTTNAAGANGADHESVYQANDTAGFSIVTYTSDAASGDTVIKHGLSTAPTFMIHKARNANSTLWWVYHKDLTNDGYMQLDDTTANQDGSTNVWRNTAPTSTVFKVGLNSIANANGRTMVAYCFAPVQGYSKFGRYTGNGNADGPFVYTGFKPAWLMYKTTGVNNWNLLDAKRSPFNVADKNFYPDGSNAEMTSTKADFLSNGFKIKTSDNQSNTSGTTYVYMAFAESPFVSSEGVPTTAR